MAGREVAVIIPAYNCGRWVAAAVESAIGQTLRPGRVIVVDDGSTDDTRSRLEPYRERGVEYVFQENAGVSAARNNGVARAEGEYVAFLDADDLWHPRKLELQVATLARRPDLGMLGTAIFDWPGDLPAVADHPEPAVREVAWEDLVVKNYFTTSSMLVRRAALQEAGPGPFDTALQGPEDYDLWLRVARRWKGGILAAPLTGYRSVAGSLGKQARAMHAGMGRILQKLDVAGAWQGTGGRMLRQKAHGYYHYSCAYMFGAAGNQATAMAEVLRSMMSYPRPFRRGEVLTRCARPKLFGAAMLRLLKLKRPE